MRASEGAGVPGWLVAHRRPIVWLVIATCVVLQVFVMWVAMIARQGAQSIVVQEPYVNLGGVVVAAGYGSVFALLVDRVPRNLVGWLFGAVALVSTVGNATWAYVIYATETIPPRLPLAELAAFLGATMVAWGSFLFVVLGLIFPTGRLLSRAWSLVIVVSAVVTIATVVAVAFGRGLMPMHNVPSPLGLPEPLGGLLSTALPVLLLAEVLLWVPAVWSLVLRYRSSDDVGRLQLKWLVYAMAVFAFVAAIFIFSSGVAYRPGSSVSGLVWLTFSAAATLVPIAAAVAILRYHLYEIETIIGRTLVYGGLTAALAGIYTAGIRFFNWLFVEMTGEDSDAALVITTLILATTFTPIKAWLEGKVASRQGVIVDPTEAGDPSLVAATSPGDPTPATATSPALDQATIDLMTERVAARAADIVVDRLARSTTPPSGAPEAVPRT